MLQKTVSVSVLIAMLAALSGCALETAEGTMSNPQEDFRHGPASPVLEPTVGAWVNDNTWGDQFAGPLPATEGREIQIVKNSRFYGPPSVHSVNLTRSDARLPQNADVRAHVTFGTGGIQNEFFCDWQQGQQFALVANTITVAASTYRPNADLPYSANDGHIFLGAMLGSGDAAPSRPLTLTEGQTQLATAGGNVTYSVPDYAVGFRIYTASPELSIDPAVASDLKLRVYSGGLIISLADAAAAALGRELPLPGAATEVNVSNDSATDVAYVVLQWVLQL